jgi:hypothetical protein
VTRIGMLKPLRVLCSRLPSTGVSAVTTSVPNLVAATRSTKQSMRN